jgi:hypothetical protein
MNEADPNKTVIRPRLTAALEPTNAIWQCWIAALRWLIAPLEPANAAEPNKNVTQHRLTDGTQPRTETMRPWTG